MYLFLFIFRPMKEDFNESIVEQWFAALVSSKGLGIGSK
jgi:hypothetical protein